jgi:hypothetical protein
LLDEDKKEEDKKEDEKVAEIKDSNTIAIQIEEGK